MTVVLPVSDEQIRMVVPYAAAAGGIEWYLSKYFNRAHLHAVGRQPFGMGKIDVSSV